MLKITPQSRETQHPRSRDHAIVERRAADMFDGAKLRRKMFLEDVRLEARRKAAL
jgi:hypothetical protein